jgi:hypothetical protein
MSGARRFIVASFSDTFEGLQSISKRCLVLASTCGRTGSSVGATVTERALCRGLFDTAIQP